MSLESGVFSDNCIVRPCVEAEFEPAILERAYREAFYHCAIQSYFYNCKFHFTGSLLEIYLTNFSMHRLVQAERRKSKTYMNFLNYKNYI